jgi:hypothetical protein
MKADEMKTLEWTEHTGARQATRKDMFDIARGLGLEVGPRASVPVLRGLIRAELERLAIGREQAKHDEEADRGRAQDEQFERVFGTKPPDLKVERDDDGLFVKIEGTTFRGEDLPGEGTWVLEASTFTHIQGHREADIEWSGDTPSGRCRATLREA